ncbi:histidine kinase [Streptomyces sp. XM4011]|uniref:sensor histidine kinase n=1 Tax=Streptomyces TaxID=1883 RepID=UPI001FFA5784|nr:histidine kinase [Streptomyces sp. XM4011]MCK1814950.1 histidine kinase [Streptomyces sp. XM4011]
MELARTEYRLPWWGELTLVVSLSAVSVSDAAVSAGGAHAAVPSVVASLVAGAALPLRYRHPLPIAGVAVAAAGLFGAMLPLLLMAFHLTAHRRARVAAAGIVTALAVNLLIQPPLSLWTPRAYGPCALFIVAMVLGLWAAASRRLADALGERLGHLHRERELREQAARSSERTAIAGEMHDVLAHRLSLIALHSGVLANRADQLDPVTADRVRLLRTASTDALADLRHVLGALRAQDTAADREPTLRELGELIDTAREAGQLIDADLDEPGDAIAPAAHRLAVYRLVQEALSNARRHAPHTPVRVVVRYGPLATVADISNPLPRNGETGGDPPGFGLVGLRERVQSLGGTLSAGADAGRWRLSARIPTGAPRPAAQAYRSDM